MRFLIVISTHVLFLRILISLITLISLGPLLSRCRPRFTIAIVCWPKIYICSQYVAVAIWLLCKPCCILYCFILNFWYHKKNMDFHHDGIYTAVNWFYLSITVPQMFSDDYQIYYYLSNNYLYSTYFMLLECNSDFITYSVNVPSF